MNWQERSKLTEAKDEQSGRTTMKTAPFLPSYIGIDLGGTKLLLGEMDRQGNLLRVEKKASGQMDHEAAYAFLAQALSSFLSHSTPGYQPCAIGIGLTGHVDGKKGIWLKVDERDGNAVPLADRIAARFSLPCFIDNDVKSAAAAEGLFGVGKDTNDFAYINVGTGIGAGIVTAGHLIRGGHANAGEVGHSSSGLTLGIPCACGRKDCVELIASGSGIDACARRFVPKYTNTKLNIPKEGRVSAQEVFALSDTDSLCRELTENAAKALANLMMNIVRVCDPEAIVLGGGVVADGFLLKRAEQYFSAHTMRYVTKGVQLTKMDSHYAGLIGACANAIRGYEELRERKD